MKDNNRKVMFYQGNGEPIHSQKTDRNALCPCGSGKKAKKCCGCETKYFKTK